MSLKSDQLEIVLGVLPLKASLMLTLSYNNNNVINNFLTEIFFTNKRVKFVAKIPMHLWRSVVTNGCTLLFFHIEIIKWNKWVHFSATGIVIYVEAAWIQSDVSVPEVQIEEIQARVEQIQNYA